jgi:hypothetical protein
MVMDPTERLASDVQTLKGRVDDLSLRVAVGEEREKRINDKIDGLANVINGWSKRMGWGIGVVVGALLLAGTQWVLSGGLAS